MGNTCYVVATVTAADWRMTVGFRALLMAVRRRRPSPSSCSVIPSRGVSDPGTTRPPRPARYGIATALRFRAATPGACAAELFTESRFFAP